jgi:hypothetical protein
MQPMYIYDSTSPNTSWGEKSFRTVLEKASTQFSPKIVQFAKQLQEIQKSRQLSIEIMRQTYEKWETTQRIVITTC